MSIYIYNYPYCTNRSKKTFSIIHFFETFFMQTSKSFLKLVSLFSQDTFCRSFLAS